MILDRSLRYGVAVGAGITALSATDVLQRVGYPGSFSLFIGAVLLSAWYGGIGPGIVTLLLSALGGSLVVQGTAHADQGLRLGLFVLVAGLAAAVATMARRARLQPKRPDSYSDTDRDKRLLAMVSEELRRPIDPLLMQV